MLIFIHQVITEISKYIIMVLREDDLFLLNRQITPPSAAVTLKIKILYNDVYKVKN